MKEPRSDATLKNLPDEAQEELWQLIRPDDPEADAISVSDLQGEIPLRHGFTVGKSAIYEWRSWYGFRRRAARARALAKQAELEAAADGLDPAAIARVAQSAFTAEVTEAQNLKGFVALEHLRLREKEIELRKQEVDQKDRRIKLLEEAAAAAKAKLENAAQVAKSKGGLSEETLKQIEEAAGLL